jgi:hypothetical protein
MMLTVITLCICVVKGVRSGGDVRCGCNKTVGIHTLTFSYRHVVTIFLARIALHTAKLASSATARHEASARHADLGFFAGISRLSASALHSRDLGYSLL